VSGETVPERKRQEKELDAGFSVGAAHAVALVRAEIVYDDDVAQLQSLDKNAFNST